jgi:hypothetical protein
VKFSTRLNCTVIRESQGNITKIRKFAWSRYKARLRVCKDSTFNVETRAGYALMSSGEIFLRDSPRRPINLQQKVSR